MPRSGRIPVFLSLAFATVSHVGCSKRAQQSPAPPVPASPAPDAAEDDPPAPDLPEPAPMGNWIEGETLAMRITHFARRSTLAHDRQSIRADKDKIFFVTDLEFTNRGVTRTRIRAEHFRLFTHDGQELPVATQHQALFATSSDELLLMPKLTEGFQVIFHAPADTTPRALIYASATSQLVGAVAENTR